jgi:hypothetical protein
MGCTQRPKRLAAFCLQVQRSHPVPREPGGDKGLGMSESGPKGYADGDTMSELSDECDGLTQDEVCVTHKQLLTPSNQYSPGLCCC